MSLGPPAVAAAVAAFLLAFPALFSIVNPIGGALIFNNVTADRTAHERRALAARALAPVLQGRESLSDSLPGVLAQANSQDRGLLQAIATNLALLAEGDSGPEVVSNVNLRNALKGLEAASYQLARR